MEVRPFEFKFSIGDLVVLMAVVSGTLALRLPAVQMLTDASFVFFVASSLAFLFGYTFSRFRYSSITRAERLFLGVLSRVSVFSLAVLVAGVFAQLLG